MAVHFDECKSSVRLESRLNHKAKVLKKGDHVVWRGVRSQIANVTRRLPRRRLGKDNLVAGNAMSWELVVAKRRRRRQAHSLHRLLLRNRRLTLLVCPVAADGARAKPLSIHRAECLLGVRAVSESDEPVSTRSASLHVPHDASFGYGAKGRESLGQDLVVDFVAKVANKDVEVVGGVLLARGVGLVSPVDADFLTILSISIRNIRVRFSYGLVHTSSVQGLHSALGRTGIIVLNESIVVALSLSIHGQLYRGSHRHVDTNSILMESFTWQRYTHILVGDDLDVLNVTSSLEDLTQDILGNTLIQASHVQRPLVRLGGSTAAESPSATGRHNLIDPRHGRGNGSRNRVVVLRDMEGRRGHVRRVRLAILAVLVAWSSSVRLGRGGQLRRVRSRSVVRHCVGYWY